MSEPEGHIPVIVDTDIGFDVDDVWALAFLLRCPEIDLRLVVTENGDTTYAAGLVSRLLEIDGRTDIPVGIGIPLTSTPRLHADSLGGRPLDGYAGPIRLDGVGAMIEEIRSSVEPVTVLAIGPLTNIASAIQRAPDIVDLSRFVGMHGSIRRGYGGAPGPNREYNVYTYPSAAQGVSRRAGT